VAAYYNEIDPFTAAWLRELIKAGHITDGEVDDRSIVNVQPSDLAGFVQCHFFAGIGGWSLALRLADWPDGRECWTGSCPCQPFSSAGAKAGGHDARDLWPAWARLIRECRPVTVFGEQVESAIAHGWYDRVCDDLEREGYALGAACLPAASVGTFHIRSRLWFVAHANRRRNDAQLRAWQDDSPQADRRSTVGRLERPVAGRIGSDVGAMGDASRKGLQERECNGRIQREAVGAHTRQATQRGSDAGQLGLSDSEREAAERIVSARPGTERSRSTWTEAEWLPCRDGKSRPVEPGTFPLAHGLPARVGRLRGYGNAIVPQVAAEVIAAYMEIA
jgi:DNA (cytosine-5)-methyltransferase 1